MTAPLLSPRALPKTPESPDTVLEVETPAPDPPDAALPYVEPALPPENEKAPTPDVILGVWNGIPNWQCTRCPFATIEGEAAIREHIAERHLEEVMTVEDRARRAGIIIVKGK
jgi:hypothetical protein